MIFRPCFIWAWLWVITQKTEVWHKRDVHHSLQPLVKDNVADVLPEYWGKYIKTVQSLPLLIFYNTMTVTQFKFKYEWIWTVTAPCFPVWFIIIPFSALLWGRYTHQKSIKPMGVMSAVTMTKSLTYLLTFSCSLLHTVKLLTWIVGKCLTPWLQDSKGPCAHGIFWGAERRQRCMGALGWRVERKNKLQLNLVSVTTISWLCSVPVWCLGGFTLRAAKSSRAGTHQPWIPLWSEVQTNSWATGSTASCTMS